MNPTEGVGGSRRAWPVRRSGTLRRDESPGASRLWVILVRLSGRQMKHRVESTAPALLAGLERLLAIDDLMQVDDLQEVLDLARHQLPRLLPDRSS
ncbi:MAG: hypothetical protein ABI353_09765 [Isosphaeraceae bacterium]